MRSLLLKAKVVLEVTGTITPFADFTKILIMLSMTQLYFGKVLFVWLRRFLDLLLLTPPSSPENQLLNSPSGPGCVPVTHRDKGNVDVLDDVFIPYGHIVGDNAQDGGVPEVHRLSCPNPDKVAHDKRQCVFMLMSLISWISSTGA
jgi:hypothetical protein